MSVKSSQDQGINLVKIFACFLVIVVHVSGINLPKMASEGWDTSNWIDSFSRVCVPLFFMISGAMLLTKDEPLSSFFKRRYSKVLPPLLFWSLVYYIYYSLTINKNYGDNPLLYMLTRPAGTHLWYFYAIAGIYLAIPLFRKIYIHSSNAEKALFIAIWFTSTVLVPNLRNGFGLNIDISFWSLNTIGSYIGFFFLGAISRDQFSQLSKKNIAFYLVLYIATGAGIAILTKWASVNKGSWTEVFYSYLTPLVVIGAYALFTVLNNLGRKITKPVTTRLLNVFSDCALGIYCIHIIVRDELYRIGIHGAHQPYFLTIFGSSFLVFAISFLVIYFVRKIKILRYIA